MITMWKHNVQVQHCMCAECKSENAVFLHAQARRGEWRKIHIARIHTYEIWNVMRTSTWRSTACCIAHSACSTYKRWILRSGHERNKKYQEQRIGRWVESGVFQRVDVNLWWFKNKIVSNAKFQRKKFCGNVWKKGVNSCYIEKPILKFFELRSFQSISISSICSANYFLCCYTLGSSLLRATGELGSK